MYLLELFGQSDSAGLSSVMHVAFCDHATAFSYSYLCASSTGLQTIDSSCRTKFGESAFCVGGPCIDWLPQLSNVVLNRTFLTYNFSSVSSWLFDTFCWLLSEPAQTTCEPPIGRGGIPGREKAPYGGLWPYIQDEQKVAPPRLVFLCWHFSNACRFLHESWRNC